MKYPINLAEKVHQNLHGEKGVSIETLRDIFEVMYHASFKTEEGDPIIFSIIYGEIDDFNESDVFTNKLTEPLLLDPYKEYNVKNIIKIAKATDMKSSSIIVSKTSNLKICGIHDQESDFYGFLNGTNKQPPIRKGILKATTNSPGQIIVYYKNKKIAEMDCGQLSDLGTYIFKKDNYIYQTIERKIEKHIVNKRYNIDEFTNKFFEVFCRIILRIKNFQRGGAMIFSLQSASNQDDLSLTYELKDEGYSKLLRLISIILRLKEKNENDLMAIAEKELDKVIWNISLLSKVDGAVLFDSNISIKAFGVKINSNTQLDDNKVKKCLSDKLDNLQSFDLKSHGTRHLSMARYCHDNPESFGVVISQDGDVRIFAKKDENLIVWENINFINFETDDSIQENVIKNITKIKEGLKISRFESVVSGEIATMNPVDKHITIS